MLSPRSRPGHTLAELLTVLTLLGLLAGLAAPALARAHQRLRVRAALDRFVAELYYARGHAARSGRAVYLRLSPGRGCAASYSLAAAPRAPPFRAVRLDGAGPRVCLVVRGAPVIRIDPRGMPDGAARTVTASLGGAADSLRISLVGRVHRGP